MNQSEIIKNGLNEYKCPQENFTIPLSGNFAGTSIRFFRATVDYCNQAALNRTHPGKVCKTRA